MNTPLYSNFAEMLENLSEKYGDNIALRTKDLEISYNDFCALVCLAVKKIRDRGLNKKHIAVVSENSPEFVILFFAVILSGNVIIPSGSVYGQSELEYIFSDSDADLVLYSDSLAELALRTSESVGIKAESIKNFIGTPSENKDIYARDGGELAVIVYTSGSEGKMNGVMLTQSSLLCSACGLAEHCVVSGSIILNLPLNHMYGWAANVLAVMICGAEMYCISDIGEFPYALITMNPEYLFLVPSELASFYRTIEGRMRRFGLDTERSEHFSQEEKREKFKKAYSFLGNNIKFIFSGGASLDEHLYEFFRKIGIRVVNLYGSTECSPIICAGSTEYETGVSIGRNIPTCEISLLNRDENGIGELMVKGGNVMLGYYKNKEKTEKVISDGWYRTGDLARIGENGFVYITGRIRNIMVLGNGENVSPEELEEKLNMLDGVEESMVYMHGDSIAADIYAADKKYHDDIRNGIFRLNSKNSDFKRISEVNFTEKPLERNFNKKIVRKRGS